jgi:flagellum-specific peptidoglycan hydrolase FlgJ
MQARGSETARAGGPPDAQPPGSRALIAAGMQCANEPQRVAIDIHLPVTLPTPQREPAQAHNVHAPEQAEFAPVLQQQLPVQASATRLVRATRTPLSGEQASSAIAQAWTAHFGTPPSRATVAILTAQWAHETGAGKSMFNYNFGGIKGAGPTGLTVSQTTREGWGDTRRTIVDNFRAYRTPLEGATDYISLLGRRFSGAIQAAERGDATGFVRGLKTGGYFTGNEQVYARSIAQLSRQILGQGAGVLSPGGSLPDAELLVREQRPVGWGASAGAWRQSTWDSPTAQLQNARGELLTDELTRAALRIAASTGTNRD